MKFGNQSKSGLLIINMIFEFAEFNPKLKTLADLVSKLQCDQSLWKLALRTNQTCYLSIY